MIEATVSRAALARAVAAAASCVDASSKVSMHTCLLVEASAGAIRVTGSNQMQSCTAEVPADVVKPGAFCVEARKVSGIVESIPGDEMIEIKASDIDVRIGAGRRSVRPLILPAADFPVWSMAKSHETIAVSASELSRLIEAASPAASRDESAYHLSCLAVETEGERLSIMATDGQRFSLSTGKLAKPARGRKMVVINVNTAKTIVKLIKSAGEVSIKISDSMIEVDTGGSVFQSKLVDATFSDMRRHDFSDYEFSATVDRAAFISTLGMMARMGGDTPRVVIVPHDGEIEIACTDPKDGSVTRDAIPAELSGAARMIAAQVHFLTGAVAAVQGDRITVGFKVVKNHTLKVSGDPDGSYAFAACIAPNHFDFRAAEACGWRAEGIAA